MEFVQFEPTVVVHPAECRGLVMPTAMFGEGAQLRNALGERFMYRYNPDHGEMRIEKARMAHCIQQEISEGRGFPDGTVMFDTTVVPPDRLDNHKEKVKRLRSKGFEPTAEAPRVRPAAHSHMGGVQIDRQARSGVPGLFAAGEAAGGVHGASRLAGNGASDVFVFGGIAGRGAAASEVDIGGRDWAAIHGSAVTPLRAALAGKGQARPDEVKASVRTILLDSAGLYRERDGLVSGLEKLDALKGEIDRGLYAPDLREAVRALEADNMVTVARFIVRSALEREESRGAHQRLEFPERNDEQWLRHVALRPAGEGYRVEAIPL
jgi:succinate dehydrogenase/fumarate reductase flavoprotein subunit